MDKTIIANLNKVQHNILTSLPQELRVAYTLCKLASVPRQKTALSRANITKAINQHFGQYAQRPMPNLPWAKIMTMPIEKLSRQMRWTRDMEEYIKDGVFQNILLGMNLETGANYQEGNLVQRVEKLVSQGKSDTDIAKILSYVVRQMAQTLAYRFNSGGRVQGLDLETKDSEEVSILDSILSLDPLSKGEASKWMSMIKTNPAMRSLILKIDQEVKRKAPLGVKMLWNALVKFPDFGTWNDLAHYPIKIEHPETGEVEEVALYHGIYLMGASSTDSPNNLDYQIKMLRKFLKPFANEARELF